MAVLDTAIQEKPKHFNDPWMAGPVPAITEKSDVDLFTLSLAGMTQRSTGGASGLHPLGEGLKTQGKLFRQTFWP
jgi:hypothetical protein